MKTTKQNRNRRYCVRTDEQSVTTTVYLVGRTVVITVSNDGSVTITEEPP